MSAEHDLTYTERLPKTVTGFPGAVHRISSANNFLLPKVAATAEALTAAASFLTWWIGHADDNGVDVMTEAHQAVVLHIFFVAILLPILTSTVYWMATFSAPKALKYGDGKRQVYGSYGDRYNVATDVVYPGKALQTYYNIEDPQIKLDYARPVAIGILEAARASNIERTDMSMGQLVKKRADVLDKLADEDDRMQLQARLMAIAGPDDHDVEAATQFLESKKELAG